MAEIAPLTVFFRLNLGSLVFPDNCGWRRADDVTHDDSIIPLVKLLRRRSVLESEFFCKKNNNWIWYMHLQIIQQKKKKDTLDTRTVLVSSWGSVHNSTE